MNFCEGRVQADVFIDQENLIVHILDLDEGGMSVTNAMGIAFQEEILGYWHSGLPFEGEADEWIWYCYGTDGIVVEFSGGLFLRSIALDNLYIFELFAEQMVDRRSRYMAS